MNFLNKKKKEDRNKIYLDACGVLLCTSKLIPSTVFLQLAIETLVWGNEYSAFYQ